MNNTAIHRHQYSSLGSYAWLLPAALAVLLLTGAVGTLLAGLAAPTVIGADGVAGIALPVP
ncbi:MAG: hypothetical protein ACK4UO_06515 [Pseudolabrys sp.]